MIAIDLVSILFHTASTAMSTRKTYVVEHLDPELEQWSALEYSTIASESHAAGSDFILSSVSPLLQVPTEVSQVPGMRIEQRGVEQLFADRKDRVCLLDPSAKEELSPGDGGAFEVFLFGGILGDDPPRGWQLTMRSKRQWLIEVDRTSELRKKGYVGRRLGPVQMTTDTAVRTTRMVVQDKSKAVNERSHDVCSPLCLA